jgi:hypothetical protein
MGVGMRWLVAVAGSLAFFVACWASLALGHVWDIGTQVGVAAALMAVVLMVRGWWAPLGREKLQEARMERQHAELVTIKKEVDIRRNEIVALLRNDGSYRITDVVIEAAINRDPSEIAAEIEATGPWVDVKVEAKAGKMRVGEVLPLSLLFKPSACGLSSWTHRA